MSRSEQPDDAPIVYALRLTAQANRDAIEAASWLAQISEDEDLGREWYTNLRQQLGLLATHPRRYAAAAESRLFGFEVRRWTYRRTSTSSLAHYVFYRVSEAGEDGPTVLILHVRSAARKPLSRAEARVIQDDAS